MYNKIVSKLLARGIYIVVKNSLPYSEWFRNFFKLTSISWWWTLKCIGRRRASDVSTLRTLQARAIYTHIYIYIYIYIYIFAAPLPAPGRKFPWTVPTRKVTVTEMLMRVVLAPENAPAKERIPRRARRCSWTARPRILSHPLTTPTTYPDGVPRRQRRRN